MLQPQWSCLYGSCEPKYFYPTWKRKLEPQLSHSQRSEGATIPMFPDGKGGPSIPQMLGCSHAHCFSGSPHASSRISQFRSLPYSPFPPALLPWDLSWDLKAGLAYLGPSPALITVLPQQVSPTTHSCLISDSRHFLRSTAASINRCYPPLFPKVERNTAVFYISFHCGFLFVAAVFLSLLIFKRKSLKGLLKTRCA